MTVQGFRICLQKQGRCQEFVSECFPREDVSCVRVVNNRYYFRPGAFAPFILVRAMTNASSGQFRSPLWGLDGVCVYCTRAVGTYIRYVQSTEFGVLCPVSSELNILYCMYVLPQGPTPLFGLEFVFSPVFTQST